MDHFFHVCSLNNKVQYKANYHHMVIILWNPMRIL